jgi:hypothetical protein
MAPSSNLGTVGDLVPDTGNQAGKKTHPRSDGAASAEDDHPVAEWDVEVRSPGAYSPNDESPFEADRRSAALSLTRPQPLAASTV